MLKVLYIYIYALSLNKFCVGQRMLFMKVGTAGWVQEKKIARDADLG